MAASNNNARPSSSKPHVRLTTADLERMCGIEPHAEKKCDYCGIPLAFPRTFTKDTFCAVCSSLLNALMQSRKNYWFNVQREYETEILADVIHKKLLLGGEADEVSQ
jgi:hypothetical protein